MSTPAHSVTPATIWTIGHSTRALEEFLSLLAESRIGAIADALCVRGIEVLHILDAKHSIVHPMTSPARIVRGALSYTAAEGE